jgi:signal transduction histidine kinase
MSSSTSLPIVDDGYVHVNENCAMRRSVKVQPYGRCSICTLKFRQCHAFRSSSVRYLVIGMIFAVLLVPTGWPLKLLLLATLAALVYQGTLDHKATNELADGQRRLRALTSSLEHQVQARTADLRRSNVDLARANVELIQISNRQGQMVVDLSHELRTPLASVKGAAQNMLDEIPGPITQDQREYLDIIVEHAERLTEDAQDIIDAARGQKAAVKLTLKKVRLDELIREVARGVEPAAKQRDIELKMNDLRDIELNIDAPKLRTVVENLLSNAVKFTDEGGKVTVALDDEPHEVRVRVVDTGIGISQSELPTIFERFARGSTDRPGTGVGLALSRELARMHGGDIVATSEPGRGSEFSLSLPRFAA